MNALNFKTILPHLFSRQARTTDTTRATPIAKGAPGRVVSFTSETSASDATSTASTQTQQPPARHDLAPLLRLVTWIFQPAAMRKNIRLQLDAPEIGLYAICHEARIQRMLENLVANALRYSPDNSEVKLVARVENGRLCFIVEDKGPGVPLAQQAGLFEEPETSFGEYAFGAQEDRSGLSVCRDTVLAHGGDILMYNRVEGGAHFEFHLPSPNARRISVA